MSLLSLHLDVDFQSREIGYPVAGSDCFPSWHLYLLEEIEGQRILYAADTLTDYLVVAPYTGDDPVECFVAAYNRILKERGYTTQYTDKDVAISAETDCGRRMCLFDAQQRIWGFLLKFQPNDDSLRLFSHCENACFNHLPVGDEQLLTLEPKRTYLPHP